MSQRGGRVQFVLVAAVALGVFASGAGATARPAPSGLIAFDSSRTELDEASTDVYAVGADGSGEVALTHNQVPDLLGGWSPDGQQLVFVNGSAPDGKDVSVMAPDGSGVRGIGKGLITVPNPWSPDGDHILVEPQNTKTREIHVLDLDGRERKLAGGPKEDDIAASWSPDGARVVFDSTRGGGNERIWVENEDGRGSHVVSRGPEDGVPSWSPDGTRIAFLASNQIDLVDPDGTRLRRLTHAGVRIDLTFLRWSPDSTQIAFVCDHRGAQICVAAARGGAVRQLTNGNQANNRSPVWSPDGQSIAFTSTRDTGKQQINVMPSAGGAARRITHDGRWDSNPAWQPAS